MKSLSVLLQGLPVLLLLVACGSGNSGPAGNQAVKEQPVFGNYYFGKNEKVRVLLREDSSAQLDMNTKVGGKIDKEGKFTMRNDSIFIEWMDGRSVISRFEKTTDYFSFKIGSTTYKRLLKP